MKSKLFKVIHAFLSIPKTIYFNFVVFGIKGFKLPVFISFKTKLSEIHKGTVLIDCCFSPFLISFGYGGSKGIISNKQSEILLSKNSKIVFRGKAQFAEGCSIRNDGYIEIGKNSSMNRNSFISCYNKIKIGDNVTAGWNVNIRDSDGHYMIKNGIKQKLDAPVSIGNHIWICSCSDILKGVLISDDSVVAYRSLVVGSFDEKNVLIGGSPARVIQHNINWEM